MWPSCLLFPWHKVTAVFCCGWRPSHGLDTSIVPALHKMDTMKKSQPSSCWIALADESVTPPPPQWGWRLTLLTVVGPFTINHLKWGGFDLTTDRAVPGRGAFEDFPRWQPLMERDLLNPLWNQYMTKCTVYFHWKNCTLFAWLWLVESRFWLTTPPGKQKWTAIARQVSTNSWPLGVTFSHMYPWLSTFSLCFDATVDFFIPQSFTNLKRTISNFGGPN